MKKRLYREFLLLFILLSPLSLVVSELITNAQSTIVYRLTYRLKTNVLSPGVDYYLQVNITDSLYKYYINSSHDIYTYNDVAKFVTPGPIKPIADLLRSIYTNDEDYVNGVLMMVHQITNPDYNVMAKYPIEYLVDGVGDCETSYLVASLTVAGGIDTAFFLWQNQTEEVGHINVGVALSSPPIYKRPEYQTFTVTFAGKTYYIAESTGDKWEVGWRVGETPPLLIQWGFTVYKSIFLTNVNYNAPELVQASFTTSMLDSSISANVIPLVSYYRIYGGLQPNLTGETINIYRIKDDGGFEILGTTKTFNGSFTFNYLSILDISYGRLRISWNGNNEYKGCLITLAQPLIGMDTFFFIPFWIPVLIVLLLIYVKKR